MKKMLGALLTAVFGFTLFATFVFGASVALAAAPTGGLTNYYTFDDGTSTIASDSSGNGNYATLVNGPVWTTAGELNGAITFNGSTSYVQTPVFASIPQSITLGVWIKPNASGGVVMTEQGNAGAWHDSQIEVETNNTIKVCVWTGGLTCVTAATGIVYGNWYHVVLDYDGAAHMLQAYVNGTLTASVAATKQYPGSGLSYGIGQPESTNAGNGSGFSGSVDDLYIYNRALSASEVAALYQSAVTPPAPDTVPPSVPANLSAYVVSSSQVTLSWQAATDNVGIAGYQVFRNGVQVGTSSAPSFTDTGLAAATSYTYTVLAFDAAGNSSAQSAPATVSTTNYGLLAYYPFDDGTSTIAHDVSGSGTNATLVNGPVWTTGQLGGALSFNGTSSYVQTSTFASVPTSITLAAWIKPNAAGGVVFSEQGQGGGWHDSQMEVETNNTIKACIWTGSLTCAVAATGITYGNWYYVVLAYDSSTHTLQTYVNGLLTSSTSATKQYPASGLAYTIGKSESTNGGNGAYFSGVIDDARIYKRALSITDVANLFQASGGVLVPPDLTTGRWALLRSKPSITSNQPVTFTVEEYVRNDYLNPISVSIGIKSASSTATDADFTQPFDQAIVAALRPGVTYDTTTHTLTFAPGFTFPFAFTMTANTVTVNKNYILTLTNNSIGSIDVADAGVVLGSLNLPPMTPRLGMDEAGGDFGIGNLYYNYAYPGTDRIDWVKAEGLGMIRIGFLFQNLQASSSGPLETSSAGVAALDNILNRCATDQVYCLLDMHNYGYYYNDTNSAITGIPGRAGVSNARLADLWAKLATHYKNNPYVWFDLMNEPNAQPAHEWVRTANTVAAAIRATGATNKIIFQGSYWDGAQTWPGSDNATEVLKVYDPLNNFAIEAHQYLDSNNSGTSPTCTVGSGTRANGFSNWLIANQLQGIIGEIGWANNAQCATEAMTFLNGFVASEASTTPTSSGYIGLTYWAAGPWWPDNYMYLGEPRPFSTGPKPAQLTQLESYEGK